MSGHEGWWNVAHPYSDGIDRNCDDCRVCCTVLGVKDVPVVAGESEVEFKETWTPCKHECKAGCAIYKDRPTACRTFECAWLLRLPMLKMKHRPARIGVLLTTQKVVGKSMLVAHEYFPGASKRCDAKKLLEAMSAKGQPVMIVTPEKRTVLAGPGVGPEILEAMKKALRDRPLTSEASS